MTVQPLALTEADARRLTERIRTALDRVSTAWAVLAERITEAYQRRADLALGYGSWAEYVEAELNPPEGLAADVRRQLVGVLSEAGMSTRAIAPTVGVSVGQAHADITSARVQSLNTSPEPERIDRTTGEVLDIDTFRRDALTDAEQNGRVVALTGPASVTTPGRVVGLDGKTYARPEKPSETAARIAASTPEKRDHRRPITDAFWEASYDLGKLADALKRLTEDERFPRNRDAIAAKNLADMKRTASTFAEVLAAIETNSQKV